MTTHGNSIKYAQAAVEGSEQSTAVESHQAAAASEIDKQVELNDDTITSGITFSSFNVIKLLGQGSYGKVFHVNLKGSEQKEFAMKVQNKETLLR